MDHANTHEFKTTREWLIFNINLFFAANVGENGWLDNEAFGWAISRDSSMVQRLLDGGDVTTATMEKILAYIKDPIPPARWKKSVLKPIKIVRRVYD